MRGRLDDGTLNIHDFENHIKMPKNPTFLYIIRLKYKFKFTKLKITIYLVSG
jgi:hypothetical protein